MNKWLRYFILILMGSLVARVVIAMAFNLS